MNNHSRRTFIASIAFAPTLIHNAAATGLTRSFQEADVTAAFLRAVIAGDRKTVRSMLKSNPGVIEATDEQRRSAFALALLAGHPDVATMIRDAGHQPDLHESALALDWERFNALAEADPESVNRHHPIGGTAMTAAALGGAAGQIWRVYAKAGIPNPPRPTSTDSSPLRAALECEDPDIAELTAASLLANGADPNATEPDGHTALHRAAERGLLDITVMLIRRGASSHARNGRQERPIDGAIRNQHRAVELVLRNAEAVPRDARPIADQPDWHGIPLARRLQFVGAAHRDIERLRRELAEEPRLARAVATTTEGAVEAGAHMGNHDIVKLLLDHGAPETVTTATMRGDLERVKSLVAHHPERLNERGAHDFPLLWYTSIGGGHIDIAAWLIDHGAEIERHDHLGTTALHFAALRDQRDLAAFLIERGANVNRAGRKFGGTPRTPLQLATDRGYDAMVDLLKASGATH